MREPADLVGDLAAAVADGMPVDWDREGEAATSDALREHLASLRLVARIAELHGSAAWADRSIGPPESGTPAEVRGHGAAGDTWGSLRLLELIGHGTFGEVYRAWDPRLEREVALKLLRVATSGTAAAGAALDALVVHEARLMARVRHPGVATIFGADHVDGRTGLWMELVRGHTLEDELTQDGPLPAHAVARCGEAIADALGAVHRAALLHRDVKTQNVMRDHDGRLVLTDFGTGLEHGTAGRPGPLAGTPLYLAPELLQGEAPTPRSDLYSLGVVLFRLATGEYPVPGRTLPEVRSAHARGLRRTLASLRPDLPAWLVGPIDRALAIDPRDRFPDARAMRNALAGAASAASPNRRRRLAVAGVMLLTAGAAAVGWRTIGAVRPRRAGADRDRREGGHDAGAGQYARGLCQASPGLRPPAAALRLEIPGRALAGVRHCRTGHGPA